MKSINVHPHLNFFHSPSPSHMYLHSLSHTHTHTHTVLILQSCLSLLTFKLMFKGVSQYIPTVRILYFGPFNPFHRSPLPFYLHPPHFSTAFNTCPYILYLHRYYILSYYWCAIILFSFLSFPEFHRVAPLLQTCSTYEFVCDHVWFCVYVYLWLCFPHMRENMWPLSFWAWLTSLNMMSSSCIHLLSSHMSFLMAE
jgi:hypothetical protein